MCAEIAHIARALLGLPPAVSEHAPPELISCAANASCMAPRSPASSSTPAGPSRVGAAATEALHFPAEPELALRAKVVLRNADEQGILSHPSSFMWLPCISQQFTLKLQEASPSLCGVGGNIETYIEGTNNK